MDVNPDTQRIPTPNPRDSPVACVGGWSGRRKGATMTGWEMFFLVVPVVGVFVAVVAAAWFVRWKRDPKAFADSWRQTPPPGSPNDWRRR